MKTKNGGKLYIYILTLAFIAGFIFLLITDMNNKKLEENGVHTQATVVQITGVTSRKGVQSKQGIAEYHDEQGYVHRYEGFVGNNEADIGTKIEIIYSKDDPDVVIKDNPFLYIAVIVSGILAGLSLLGSLLITFGAKDRLSVSCMQQSVSGEELERIVREYLPQTKSKYLSKRARSVIYIKQDKRSLTIAEIYIYALLSARQIRISTVTGRLFQMIPVRRLPQEVLFPHLLYTVRTDILKIIRQSLKQQPQGLPERYGEGSLRRRICS